MSLAPTDYSRDRRSASPQFTVYHLLNVWLDVPTSSPSVEPLPRITAFSKDVVTLLPITEGVVTRNMVVVTNTIGAARVDKYHSCRTGLMANTQDSVALLVKVLKEPIASPLLALILV